MVDHAVAGIIVAKMNTINSTATVLLIEANHTSSTKEPPSCARIPKLLQPLMRALKAVSLPHGGDDDSGGGGAVMEVIVAAAGNMKNNA
jgi:hypothetical protein